VEALILAAKREARAELLARNRNARKWFRLCSMPAWSGPLAGGPPNCALAARAEFVITRDPDLLELEKPFGIQMLTPRAFLSRLQAGLWHRKGSCKRIRDAQLRITSPIPWRAAL